MLKREIGTAKRNVLTDAVQITLGEVSAMYTAKELNIFPEFQRLYRWSKDQKSSFIESILIGIPIPPVFVFEKADGTWELIDGLQRISTVLEFMGVLRYPKGDETSALVLQGTKYLPSLEGVSWPANGGHAQGFDRSMQLFFRRSRIEFQILKHPSDHKTKFDLFQRLNRGGEYATEQEVRTCSMVLADPKFTRKARRLADSDIFTNLFRVTESQQKKQLNLEYVVRILVHSTQDYKRGLDVQEFLTHGVLDLMGTDQKTTALEVVAWTIDVLHKTLGDDAMLPPADPDEGGARKFSLRALECIAAGVARNRESVSALRDMSEFIRTRTASFWQQPEVWEMSASGLRGTERIQKTVPFGRRWFNPTVDVDG